MTLEVEYKGNRFGYIEMKYVVDIRDFHKKENKYVIEYCSDARIIERKYVVVGGIIWTIMKK